VQSVAIFIKIFHPGLDEQQVKYLYLQQQGVITE